MREEPPLLFSNLPVGARFYDWGDLISNWDAPMWNTYEKVGPDSAREVEVNGVPTDGHAYVGVSPQQHIKHPAAAPYGTPV